MRREYQNNINKIMSESKGEKHQAGLAFLNLKEALQDNRRTDLRNAWLVKIFNQHLRRKLKPVPLELENKKNDEPLKYET